MYSKQEASQMRQEFWTAFGQYMSPLLSAEGEKVSWVNYKTGEKDISFRLQADAKMAIIALELSHKDLDWQQLYFDQLKALEGIWKQEAGEGWKWQEQVSDDYGRTISRVYKEIEGVNLFDRQCWPRLISFFKQELLSLDRFWSQAKYSFEALR
ncbi:MAG TPA: DUF4268 domain-containing protein [Flavisolibacter sp.]|jgi:hypothetical protein|nr:DUF4268 domain-containing protein [Flavisolibacter sp.]